MMNYIAERLIEQIETNSADTSTSWGMTHRSEKIQRQKTLAV